jgi:hypothetical protein
MTDADRWKLVCQRAGTLLNDWMQKHSYLAGLLPVMGVIASVMQEASLSRIERLLDEIEEGA